MEPAASPTRAARPLAVKHKGRFPGSRPFPSRDTNTYTSTSSAEITSYPAWPPRRSVVGIRGCTGLVQSAAPKSKSPPPLWRSSSTATLVQSVLILVGGIATAFAEGTGILDVTLDAEEQDVQLQEGPDAYIGEPTKLDQVGRAPQHSGTWILGLGIYIPLGLFLLLFLFALTYSFKRRSRIPRSKATGSSRFIQSAIAMFSFTLLLWITGFCLRAASGDYDHSAVSRTSWQPNQTVAPAPVFTIPASATLGRNVLPNIIDPEAVDPQTVCPGYKASNIDETEGGFTAELDLAGPACNVYGNDIEHLSLSVDFQADDRVHVDIRPRFISPENESWFLLPEVLVPRPPRGARYQQSDSALIVSWSNDPTFSFSVKRRETNDTLFSTEGKVLVYEDQFVEFASALPERYNLYGLGEVIHGFRLGDNLTRTLFAADVGDTIDANLYGSHPIYLDTRYFVADDSGELTYVQNTTDKANKYVSYTHGVFLRNAHAQEILLRPSSVTWRTLGGSIDLYFYSGPKAQDVIRAYQQTAVGLPAMQQYWSLGFHQCRWGYKSWAEVEDVVDNFARFEIPLETIWTDIDYMKQYRDFENDPVRFGYTEGSKFLAKLHANHQHYVPIIDSAIYAPNPENPDDAYPPYDRGVEAKAFMLNPDGSIYYGAVWPGYTVFPDWVGAVLDGGGAIDWWIDEILRYSKKVAFDGIWIDMSEVSSFCVGSCGTGNLTLNPAHPPFELPGEPGNLVLQYPEGFNSTNSSEAMSASSASRQQEAATATTQAPTSTSYYRTTPTSGARNVNWPPYVINNSNGELAGHAVSPNATHHGGYLEYDVHNLFGHMILNATYQALLKVHEGKRPFIIGRSTFAGSGKWAGHWGGDNAALWAYMYFSIPQALSFSIFGIPMFGVDTCGFAGNTDYELCSRWMQLSAFFPFYRNHNILGAISQEPYVWSSVAEATKTAMRIRYSLLPYMYTLMARASLEGSTVMRALAWEFPAEPWLADADRQFMLGSALMVTPCLEQGASTVGVVFPGVGDGTVWYDWYTLAAVKGVEPGQNVTIDAPLGHIPLYLRGGNVVPTQEPGMTTTESRRNPWGLIVALDRDGSAEGELYLDDGESLEPDAVTWVHFSATNNSVAARPEGNYVDTNRLANVTVLGLPEAPSMVWLNGNLLATSRWSYSADSAVLSVQGLHDLSPEGAWAAAWELTWE
ncbi:glycoside hydrolase family 31 protein [Thermothielavioides terrestris NRRL 8126]|uniref:alpha-glucosidase n=1 Tax=Thermothielavioides terrestris (strain ATCC 38088 / NRRL 8126) TaxID=578455 RepID=G2RFM7_THETT|nr:glycoside hydrolase family 31 protein [Thermothielavioides terrestris NRRL 8126]AEO70510.1 glycoside hydrolase family 31 protein [Thermothielavioides terrestris NRRL 8126]